MTKPRRYPNRHSPVREQVQALLHKHGPLPIPKIIEAASNDGLELTNSQIKNAIGQARLNHPGKFFRIARYTDVKNPVTSPTRASVYATVYAAEEGEDVPRPIATKATAPNA